MSSGGLGAEQRGLKFHYLDGIRGLAAMIVVLDHYAFTFYPWIIVGGATTHAPHTLTFLYSSAINIFFNGSFAVSIFFVLSGFVLSYKYLLAKSTNTAPAIIKRYFRLMIPALGSVLIAYLLMRLGFFHHLQTAKLTGSDFALQIYQFTPHLLAAGKQGLIGVFTTAPDPTNWYNPILWTLKIELLGSFIVFAVVAIFSQRRLRYLAYLVLALALYQTYYLGFILGMVLADFAIYGGATLFARFIRRGGWILFFILGVFLAQGIMAGPHSATLPIAFVDPGTALEINHTLGACAIILAVGGSTLLGSFFSMKPFRFLGRVSFSVYLLHFLILMSFSSYLFNALYVNHSYSVSFTIMFIVSMIVLLLSADIYARYVDRGAVNFASFFYRRLSGLSLNKKDRQQPSQAPDDPKLSTPSAQGNP